MKKKLNFTVFLLLCLVWFCVFPAQAQEAVWEQINGPYGGRITQVIAGKNGSVCAATEVGGLYVSNDYGNHWSEKITERIMSLAIDKNNKLYAGGSSLYTSKDDGKTWISESVNCYPKAIAVDSANHIYVGGGVKIIRSDDGGETWIELALNTSTSIRSLGAGPAGVVYASCSQDGVYKSSDYGVTWSAMNSGFKSSYDSERVAAFIITKSGNVLCSTIDGKVYHANSDEDSWSIVLDNLTHSPAFAIDYSGTIYHGSFGNYIYKSTNDGIDWIMSNNIPFVDDIRAIATNDEGQIFIGTLGMGVFCSSDMGLSWEEKNEGLDNTMIWCMNGNSKNEIFTGSIGGGIQKSSDGGASWYRIGTDLDPFLIWDIEVDNSDRIFMSNEVGAYISENDGKDWRMIPDIDFGSQFAFSKDGHIVASCWTTVKISDNQALTWDILLENQNLVDITVNDSNYIFASAQDGIHISRDFGTTWIRTEMPSDRHYYYYYLYVSKSGSLFVSAADKETWDWKLFRSDDNGASWNDLVTGLLFFQGVTSYASDIQGCIYVGTRGAGVYRSCDNGNTWIPFNNGLKRMFINSVYIDHEGYLYAGSEGGNYETKSYTSTQFSDANKSLKSPGEFISGGYLFKIKTSGASSVENSKPSSQDFMLEQNFPNPFSTNSTIRFNLAQAENVSLKVYNSLGQLVSNPVNGWKEAGLHEVVINGTEIPAGIYFYRLQTGNGSMERKFVVCR